MPREHKDDFQDIFRYARRHGLLEDDLGRALALNAQCGVVDEFIYATINKRVRDHEIRRIEDGPFEEPRLFQGDALLGLSPRENAIRTDILGQGGSHVIVLSGSGGGKTVLFRALAIQVVPQTRGAFLVDLVKREFSPLVPHFRRVGIDVLLIPGRRLRISLCQVPRSVDPIDYAPRLADALVQAFSLPPGANRLLHVVLIELYRSFGVLDGTRRYPTPFDIYAAVEAKTDANHQSRRAILDNMEPVLRSLGPEVLGYHEAWPNGEEDRIVYDFSGLSEHDRNCLLTARILPVFVERVDRGVSNASGDLSVWFDEAAPIVSTRNPDGGIAATIPYVRGVGIRQFFAVQTADVAPIFLSNCAIKICGRCGSARDYDVMAGAMGLTSEQRQLMPNLLQPGTFVGHVSQGPWRSPFVFRVPHVTLSETVPAGTAVLGRYEHWPVLRAEIPSRWDPPSAFSVHTNEERTDTQEGLQAIELRFLALIVENPGTPSSAFAKLLKVGNRRAKALRDDMVARGYLREHQLSTGSRGRTAIVLEPTQKATDALAVANDGGD